MRPPLIAFGYRFPPLILAAWLAMVVACTPQATTNAVSSDVAATEIALTAAETLALSYTSLPRCPVAAPACSTQAAVDNIKALDNKAYTAVVAARSNSALISMAVTAISAFRNAIPGS